MREIKFRAWDKKLKKMINKLESIDFWIAGVLVNEVLYADGDEHDEGWGRYPRDTILMQYTGSEDKNGKDIYDGDIVADDMGETTTIDRWVVAEVGYVYFREFLSTGLDLEIIGNIYENPELMNANK